MKVKLWLDDYKLEFENVARVRVREHRDNLKIEKQAQDEEGLVEKANIPKKKVKEWRVENE